MSSQPGTMAAAMELFYSYSHEDARFCEMLERHLKALQRSGLIRSWYDRKIETGTEWGPQIQAALERAGIILLLLSPDFMASDYCYEIELPLAMKRHEAGEAVVIPILLRPFVYKDAPFAKLQMLPTGARPVIEWGRRDQAFNDIAGTIRTVILEGRLRAQPPVAATDTRERVDTQERVLDAAIQPLVIVDEPADVVTLIRLPRSVGLKAILASDDSYAASPDDVKSTKEFEMTFARDASGKPLAGSVELALLAAGCEPESQRKEVRVPSKGDSPVCVFMLTPKREGRLRLTLEVHVKGELIETRSLATTAVAQAVGPAADQVVAYQVAEMPLRQQQYQFSGRESDRPTTFEAPLTFAPAPAPPMQRPIATATPPPAQKKSKWPMLGAVGVTAAGLVFAVSLVVSQTGTHSRPTFVAAVPRAPDQPSGSSDAEKHPSIDILTREIAKQPDSPQTADLYMQRAQAFQGQKNYKAALADAEKATLLATPEHKPYFVQYETSLKKELGLQRFQLKDSTQQ